MGGVEPVIHVHARDSVGSSVGPCLGLGWTRDERPAACMQARAATSQPGAGLVVVPISELVPLEAAVSPTYPEHLPEQRHVQKVQAASTCLSFPGKVWDVWYAMDDGSDETDEKLPEARIPVPSLLLHFILNVNGGDAKDAPAAAKRAAGGLWPAQACIRTV